MAAAAPVWNASDVLKRIAESAGFFDEVDADGTEPNGYGDTHSVLSVN